MPNRIDIKIFIASSKELEDERKESVLLIVELNKRYPHLHLEPILFEFDTSSGNVPKKKRVQDNINQILNEAHIVIILFYSKAGKFTVEEFKEASNQEKKIYLYLKEGFAPDNLEEGRKYLEVLALKKRIERESALRYQSYKTLKDYNGFLNKDLGKYIDTTYGTRAKARSGKVFTTNHKRQSNPFSKFNLDDVTNHKDFQTQKVQRYRILLKDEVKKKYGELHGDYKFLENNGFIRSHYLTYTGVLLFTDKPAIYLPSAITRTTKYEGASKNSKNSWKYLDSCVIDQLKEAEEFIEHNIGFRYKTSGDPVSSVKSYQYPMKCVREMIANAICHRNYSDNGRYIYVDIFSDRIEIANPGTWKSKKTNEGEKLALSKLEGRPSQVNISLSRAIADINMMQMQGNGIHTSLTDCEENNAPEPEVSVEDGYVIVTIYPIKNWNKPIGTVFDDIKNSKEEIKTNLNTQRPPLTRQHIMEALQEVFSKGISDEQEIKKILAESYQLLSADEQKAASTVSVFPSAFPFDAAKALLPEMDIEKLEQIIVELSKLGFLIYDKQLLLFDIRPILRSYLYSILTDKDIITQLAITYFTKQPAKEKIIIIDDLAPAIKFYHHLIAIEKHNEAFKLFTDWLFMPLFYQFAKYDKCISLCRRLFTTSSNPWPKLTNNRDQAYILNVLGLCYAYTGQLNKANKSWKQNILTIYHENDQENLGITLKNISEMVHIPLSKLSESLIQLAKSAALLKETNPYSEASNYFILGSILIAQYSFTKKNEVPAAQRYLGKAMAFCKREEEWGLASGVALQYTKLVLARADAQKNQQALHAEALSWGIKTIEYANQYRISFDANLLFFLCAYESISRALIAIIPHKVPLLAETGQVFFYDKHFQHIIDTVVPGPRNYSILAERSVKEGLTLSRQINSVYQECIFLLLRAQIEWLKITEKQKEIAHFKEIEKTLTETYALAERIEFRMLLTDLHLFCVEVLIELNKLQPAYKETLLGQTARGHLKKAREYAIDTSTYEDLFLPPDGSADEFYKDIPEYKMLKRGMTDEEHIKNGYYAAWLRAEKLEEKLKEL